MLHKSNKLRFGAAIVAGLMSAGCLLADISVAMAAPPPPPQHRDDRRKPPPPPPPPQHREHKEHKDTNGSFWTGLIVGGIAGVLLSNNSSKSSDAAVSSYNDAVIYDEAGVKAFNNGDYDKAIDKFDKAIFADHNYMLPYLHRSKAYLAKGMYSAALDDAETCIRYGNDRYAEAYAIKAKARQYKGDSLYDVLWDINQAIRIEPNNRLWYYERAKVYRALGRDSEASSDFNKAWEMSTPAERTEMYKDYYDY